MKKPLLILIAGPYRSGTDGDAAAIARNLERLETAAAPIHRLGHVPMIGEWVALPTLRGLDAAEAADGDVMYETAARLLQHCDAVLRLPGNPPARTTTSPSPSNAAFRSITASRRSLPHSRGHAAPGRSDKMNRLFLVTCPSGRRSTLGKRVLCKQPRVRIPPSPPNA